MITGNKYRILIWLVVILFAMNLATIGSLIYQTRKSRLPESRATEDIGVATSDQGARFFRDQLELGPDQMVRFRDANREYNRKTHRLARDLEMLRVEMVSEMTGAHPDTVLLNSVSREIGNRHRELKQLTAAYYLEMRACCTPEQKEKLDEIFLKMVGQDNPGQPDRGRRRGHGWDSLPPGRN